MNRQVERRLLQLTVALAALVPLLAGAAGVIRGPAMIKDTVAPPDMVSHYRYLSGLLLGIGLAFCAAIPTIQRRSELFLVLSATVMVGGLARLASLAGSGGPGTAHQLALAMELLVVPLLFAWQRRLARRFEG